MKFLFGLFLLLLPFSAHALLPGVSLIDGSPEGGFELIGSPEDGSASFGPLNEPNSLVGWHVETQPPASGPHRPLELRAPITRAVAAGNTALIHFCVRAIRATDESGAAFVRVTVRPPPPGFLDSVDTQISVTSEWRRIDIPFTFIGPYEPGTSHLVLGFDFPAQTIEIEGITAEVFGPEVTLAQLPHTPSDYRGRAPDAAWRTAALERIRKIRQRNFVIEVTNSDGLPASGVTVSVEMQRHAFQFGSASFLKKFIEDTPDNRRYRELSTELFNTMTPVVELKWPAWSGERPGVTQQQTLTALHWLKDHGFYVRGHVLLWPAWRKLPTSIASLRGAAEQAEIPRLALRHITDVMSATRACTDEWDVLNEPYEKHDLMDVFGPHIMVDWFQAARSARPDIRLYLNDYGNHDAIENPAHVRHFEETARYLLAEGAPLGGLGLQAHIHGIPNPPEHVLATLDRYATLGLPIRITEFDINTDDPELQADYLRDFYIAVFSHPSVVGISMWDFWEGSHWIPKAALYRRDWTAKPAAEAYRQLVKEQWWTSLTGTCDRRGEYAGRGFLGTYVVRVSTAGQVTEHEFSLVSGEDTARIHLLLGQSGQTQSVSK